MKIDNAMTVFKELPKTNCRECGVKTCLAFAGSVFQRYKAIGDCPHVEKAVVEKFSDA
jgi:CO dehydrogenase/acetyl-CoA synthase gamma subunit (corrinoid Fe-S protein)